MVWDPSKLVAGQTVRLKKTATNYPGHDAVVVSVFPGRMLVRLKIIKMGYSSEDDNPATQYLGMLDFPVTAIKNPNPPPKNVRYVSISTTDHSEVGRWDGLSKALDGTKEAWLAGGRKESIEIFLGRTSKKTGVFTEQLIITFHEKREV